MNAIKLLPAVLAITAIGCVAMGARDDSYHPVIDPANFVSKVDNPYFPLVPGTVWRFTENNDEGKEENEVTVTHDTRTILGVKCVIVRDTVMLNGKLKEDTDDWYAQDKQGTVWYFGEATRAYKDGQISTEGSWEAGVGEAQAGIIMPGTPKIGEAYRQEYLPGHAEDMSKIVAFNEAVTVPAGTFTDAIRTDEWSGLAPGTEHKWYVRGIGVAREVSEKGDVAVLISVSKP